MPSRSLFAVLAASFALALAGCGGGSSSSAVPSASGGNGSGGTSGGGSVGPISSSTSLLQFSNTNPQSFTISSTTAGATAPVADAQTCAGIATVSGGGGPFPATYTVTPTASLSSYSTCTLVFSSGQNVVTVAIVVGTNSAQGNYPQALTVTPSSLAFAGSSSAAQTFSVTASGGTGQGSISLDASACAGLVNVSGTGGVPPQSFTVTPVGSGGCSIVVIDGGVSTFVPVTVGQTTTPASISVSPSSVTFATPTSAPQSVAVNYSGYVGTVTFNQSSCNNIATFTIANGSASGASGTLGTGTVTPVGIGTCTVTFSSTSGGGATLSINVQ